MERRKGDRKERNGEEGAGEIEYRGGEE